MSPLSDRACLPVGAVALCMQGIHATVHALAHAEHYISLLHLKMEVIFLHLCCISCNPA